MVKGLTFVHWSRRLPNDRRIKAGAVIAGLIWSLSTTLAAFLLLGLWVIMTRGVEYHLTGVLSAATLLGAALGGAVSGKAAGKQGWLHGATVSVIYGTLLMLLASAGGPEAFTGLTVAGRLSAYGLLGAAGGIVGVNISVLSRKKLPAKRIF